MEILDTHFQEPILNGFSRLQFVARPDHTKTKLLMEMGRVIAQKKRQNASTQFFTDGNPIMDDILTFLNRSGYHLAWDKVALLGCSAGGDVALRGLFKQINVPHIPIIIAMHHNPGFSFTTKFEMNNKMMTSVTHAKGGQPIRGSYIYFLPGDQNINYGVRAASFSMRQILEKQRFRPNIDKVIINAANRFSSKLFTVIMSGLLDDGSKGIKVAHLKRSDVWVQDPKSALFKNMPENAINALPSVNVGSIADIANKINKFAINHLTVKPI